MSLGHCNHITLGCRFPSHAHTSPFPCFTCHNPFPDITVLSFSLDREKVWLLAWTGYGYVPTYSGSFWSFCFCHGRRLSCLVAKGLAGILMQTGIVRYSLSLMMSILLPRWWKRRLNGNQLRCTFRTTREATTSSFPRPWAAKYLWYRTWKIRLTPPSAHFRGRRSTYLGSGRASLIRRMSIRCSFDICGSVIWVGSEHFVCNSFGSEGGSSGYRARAGLKVVLER